ncbi:hypothetical protein REPUB_Repub05bG0117600 [Reevesia pubescens]
MLFAKATSDQVEVIMDCVRKFSEASGLNISLNKSRMFVSPNVDRAVARSLSNACGISLTSDLGNYLGVPIIHNRVKKYTYAPLVDKVLKKLADWKGKVLSPAGRRTLIQSTTTAIPVYTMQSAWLPSSTCKKLDQINNNFLWGGSSEAGKNHLVNWNQVCAAKCNGGLGLRKARENNVAMLAKTGWKLHSRHVSLWSDVFRGKYLKDKEFLGYDKLNGCSSTWRGIIKTQGVVAQGVKWRVGNGSDVKFWTDWWVGSKPLINSLQHTLAIGNDNMKVGEVIDVDGSWDLQKISALVPQENVEEIRAVPLNTGQGVQDRNSWGMTSNGSFSVSSAYALISNSSGLDSVSDEKLGWIWKLKCPERVRFFIWLLYQNKLNTNVIRAKKGMTTLEVCDACLGGPETIEHVMKDCPLAVQIWRMMKNDAQISKFLDKPFRDWVKSNCFLVTTHGQGVEWNVLFMSTLWSIWKHRNLRIFEGQNSDGRVVYTYAMTLSKDIMQAWSSKVIHIARQIRWIKWEPPITGYLCLNTDGAVKTGSGIASAGGLIRDENGRWIKGFLVNIGKTDSLQAELWGMREGLRLAKDLRCRNLVTQSDAALVVNMLNTELTLNHPLGSLVNECKLLLENFQNLTLRHVFREANRCADKLANLAQLVAAGVTLLESSPPELFSLLQADSLGLEFLRL